MDNLKTGSLIREARKAKGLTQKTLAEQLHITDRAVSKWERGLNAPDIALLEPLAEILNLSVTELISGEQIREDVPKKAEAVVKEMIIYSDREIKAKTKNIRTRTLVILFLFFVIMLTGFLSVFWWEGAFDMIGRFPSPDGRYTVTAYDFSNLDRFSDIPSVTIKAAGEENFMIVYENSSLENIWWSPDGSKYVISLDTQEGRRISLEWMEESHETNLNAVLTFGVEASELSRYGYANKTGWPEINYQFLQWSMDSESLLFYYSFVDADGVMHEGYFWYNCIDGSIDGILEMRDTLYFEF